ncbi:MAG: hypothetical protein WC621_03425 [Patescibacteria group bacterium]
MENKTFYLWDLADTIFIEKWNAELSGVPSFNAYVESLGYDLKTISPLDYELCYEKPYRDGLYDLSIADGFKEVLTWTKNNGVFTTGNKEQINWRAEQLLRKYGFGIRDFLKEIYSTFDYSNTNVKTEAMLVDLIGKKFKQGLGIIVYTDDREANCRFFISAAEKCQNNGVRVEYRVYNLGNDDSKLEKLSDNYYKIGDLYQLKDNEENLLKPND